MNSLVYEYLDLFLFVCFLSDIQFQVLFTEYLAFFAQFSNFTKYLQIEFFFIIAVVDEANLSRLKGSTVEVICKWNWSLYW